MSDKQNNGPGRPEDRSPDERPRENAGPERGIPPGGLTGGAVQEEPRTWPEDAAQQGDATGGAKEGDWPEEPEETAQPEEDSAARISELEDRWRRALADLDNYRKRTVRALERERVDERARTTAEWLPVLDNLERALEHAEAEPDAVIQGVRSVLDQARDVINRLGYPRRDDEGEPFDPVRHEAVSTLAGTDAPDGTIVQVVRPGYGNGETQLRPALVVVAKGRGDGSAP